LETQGYEVTPFLLPAASVNAPHRRERIWFIAYNASYSNLLRFDKCIQYDEVNTSEGRVNAFSNIDKGDVNGNAPNSMCIRLEHTKETRDISESERKTRTKRSESSKSFEANGINGNVTDSQSERLQGMHQARRKDKQHGKDSKVWGNIAGHNKENNRGNSINEDATDSNGFGLRGQSDRIGNSRFINKKSKGNNWQNFPTVSPICDGDDGISNRLDSITFSKWRNESIKAGGNAVVPQVVYQIFKAIEKYNELDKQLTI
jgi:DNA (cytosine-5)-methyltransferase 1